MRVPTSRRQRSIHIAVALCACALTAQARADDAFPAQFPTRATAILVQGSVEARFLGDVNAMGGVFSNPNYNWNYGLQTLTTGGAGAAQTSPANVRGAMANAGVIMWIAPVGAQNFVYYQSGHGNAGTGNKNSTMEFNGTSSDADTFTGWVKDNLTAGHTQYSTDGTTATTCDHSMTYILEPCFSGGQIFDLTTNLADPVTRKKSFPFLSDITVMTAADYNECSLANAGNNGNSFSQAFYGYTNTMGNAVPGALQTKNPISEWDVYKTAAQRDDGNPPAATPAYTINAAFGTGNNASMYVPGTSYAAAPQAEHPIYRHVNFYPALTLMPSLPDATMGVAVNAEPNTLDMRLNAPNAPGNGPVPLLMSIFGVPSSDTLMVSRQKKVWDQNPSNPDLAFVQYYIFQLSMLNGSSFSSGSISISYNQDTDPTQITAMPFDIFFEPSPDAGWIDLHATQDPAMREVTAGINGANGLGQFALVVVPEPLATSLLLLAGWTLTRRQRRLN
jgi:hypothetical protein